MKNLMKIDPFRAIGRWEPFEELRRMQREMDRYFERHLGGPTVGSGSLWVPAVESYTKEGRLVFRCELPGVDPKDLEVSLLDRELVIKGERKTGKETKEEQYYYQEISYGTFERRFPMPEGAKLDEVKANFTNGILEISLPVPEAPAARRIAIETTASGGGEHKVKKAA